MIGHLRLLHASARLLAFAVVSLAVALSLSLVCAKDAHADLTVYVGYTGGPYYEKARFTDAELAALSDGAVHEYSSFDSAYYLRKGFGKGPELASIFQAAGIDPSAMWRFYFSTEDAYVVDDGGYGNEAWYYGELCGMTRYYFPDYPTHVDFELRGTIYDTDELWSTAQATPTIIAMSSSFYRIEAADDPFWTDSSLMTRDLGYRVMFGQTDPTDGNARNSAQMVRAITCIIGGNDGSDLPKIEIDLSGLPLDENGNLKAEVGDTFTIMPALLASDVLVSQLGIADIVWYSGDENVATVTKNADGSITVTIVGEGTVRIGASYGNSPYEQFRSSAQVGFASGGAGGGDPSEEEGEGEAAGGVALGEGSEMAEMEVEGGGMPSEPDGPVSAVESVEAPGAMSYKLDLSIDATDSHTLPEVPWLVWAGFGVFFGAGGLRAVRFEVEKDRGAVDCGSEEGVEDGSI